MDTDPVSTVDDYIAAAPAAVRPVLDAVRATVRATAPQAQERISYRMPAYFQQGALVYFGAFKQHIGFYPPVHDAALRRACARYAGEKGNLRFPLDQPIPHDLIARIVQARVRENAEKKQAKKPVKKSAAGR